MVRKQKTEVQTYEPKYQIKLGYISDFEVKINFMSFMNFLFLNTVE